MKKYLRDPKFLVLAGVAIWVCWNVWKMKVGKPLSPLFLKMGLMGLFSRVSSGPLGPGDEKPTPGTVGIV